jgi:hypothetical protein
MENIITAMTKTANRTINRHPLNFPFFNRILLLFNAG